MESDLTMTDILVASFMCTIVVFVWGLLIYFHYRARRMVYDWAEANNYKVIKLRFRFIFKGPWTWWGASEKRQKVFYAELMNAEGRVKGAFVKCGDYWRGLVVDKVEVKWDTDD
jgi:hypothetical protein